LPGVAVGATIKALRFLTESLSDVGAKVLATILAPGVHRSEEVLARAERRRRQD
jgi:hypothetical protein